MKGTPMNLDVVVFLWGALVTVIVVAGMLTGEWKEKLYDTQADPQDEQ
jgi:hypothetical protein